ncbi:MAG: sulfide/dihydroorotate dehydrogenase-like FAD/NAD-binding protein [Candidatus Bathyarchaeota archaeon]|nr:MAG: sulfide/dihydroorotate dehydrogenase-like FAD/NAD-binding protein [Candidatus Bathyarchaeota archaeon]
MNRILTKRTLTQNVKLFEVEAPLIARKAKPGHFVILRFHEKGERIPITLAGSGPKRGTITIVFAEVGKSSTQLGNLEEGDEILNLLGPLGNPFPLDNYGTILCIGGGVFIGALIYHMKALKEAGNKIVAVLGSRGKKHLFFVEEAKEVADELYVTTDDGSAGLEGLVFLEDLLKERSFDHVFTIGPTSLQKEVSEMTRPHGIRTTVNLFPIMVDGMGMCGACRVTVGGETKFACVDGPDFDGHEVDFDELISRMRVYNPQEKIAMILYQRVV